MSPIIYTPHNCEEPSGNLRDGTLWQCAVCETIWEVVHPRFGEWRKIAEPRRGRIVADALKRPAPTSGPVTPTVTPGMVQLALDTYAEHADFARDKFGVYTECSECAECGTGPYGVHTIKEHALDKATEALQDALWGETRE